MIKCSKLRILFDMFKNGKNGAIFDVLYDYKYFNTICN